MLVAEVRNWPCGMAALLPHDQRRELQDMAEVEIFVRRSFRSYGVGRQLMRAVQAEAGRLGYRKLIGRVLGDSEDTLRLCQATGWRVVGRHEQHARHGERLRDVVVVEFLVPPIPAAS
jgi:phosphinothricin acetyltransferase